MLLCLINARFSGGVNATYSPVDPEGYFSGPGFSGDNSVGDAISVYSFGCLALDAPSNRAFHYSLIVANFVHSVVAFSISGCYFTMEGY